MRTDRTTTHPIPLSKVVLGEEEEALVLQVMRSGHLAQGPMVARLEEQVAAITGTRHAVAVSSGTAALVAALQASGIGPGDEVITSPLTFGATLNAILKVGATARFVDVLPDGTMDPDLLAIALQRYASVVLPVHLYGLPCHMEEIAGVATQNGVAVIEDSAQAIGASVGGRAVGSFGIGCFSFYATKNVTTGEGGAVTTNEDSLAEDLRLLRNQGMSARYSYEVPGHNYRMTDVAAAIGVPQLIRLTDIVDGRRHNAAVLSEGLAGLRGIGLPRESAGRHHVFHHYAIKVAPDCSIGRNELARRLKAQGIGTGVIYPSLVFDHPCYREDPRVVAAAMPVASQITNEVLCLPVHPGLNASDLDRIITAVRALVS